MGAGRLNVELFTTADLLGGDSWLRRLTTCKNINYITNNYNINNIIIL